MIVNEQFYSLQGEGRLAGVPSIFIRLAGCPLRCRWCDTRYAWDAQVGTQLSPQDIVNQAAMYPTRYVVITGGEPLVHPDLAELTCGLQQHGYHITVETSGIKFLPDLLVDMMSISPKLQNSMPQDPQTAPYHEQIRFNLDSLQRLIEVYPYQLKFVVDQPEDFDQIAECLQQLDNVNPYNIYLMPQATSIGQYIEKSRWLSEYCLRSGFCFSPRLQVMLWENQRGK